MAAKDEVGRYGERFAAAWYTGRGYDIVARNWRVRAGEIDLIAAQGEVVVFCEVKRRMSGAFGSGAEAVDWRKQQRIRTVARHWLAQHDSWVPEIRFDVAVVDGAGHVEVIEGCF